MNTAPTAQPEFSFAPATITKLGDGSYRVVPGRPVAAVQEISTGEVARILSCSRAQVWYLRNTSLGAQLLQWRFISPKRGKILWQIDSVLAFKEALSGIGK